MFLYRTNQYNNKNNIYVNIIRECYIEVLGREPDPSGLNTYTRQLKRGWSIIDIKMDLYNSPEGKMVLMKKTESQSKRQVKPQSKPQVKSQSKPQVKPQVKPELKANKEVFYESVETNKLSDLEFFNILEKNVKTTWNKDNNNTIDNSNKEVKSYKITKGFINQYNSISIKILYCVKKSTYNKFYIEETNEEDCIKIYIMSKNKKLYLKVSDTNLTDNSIKGLNLIQENFINNNIAATIFKKQCCEDSDKFYLLIKSGIYINEKLLHDNTVNKYFVIDNQSNTCKLLNNLEFNQSSNNIVKFWI